jgi:hypothetical protein
MSDPESQINNKDLRSDEKDVQKFGGIINPYIKYLYGFFHKYVIQKFGLTIEKDFWYFLSFGILTSILFFSGIPYWLPVLFLSLAGLDFILHNGGFLKEKFWISPSKEIDDFFLNLEKKSQYQVIQFISLNRLSTSNIIRILQLPKFNDSCSIYDVIAKKQWIHSEMLDYIIENDLYVKMGDDLFCAFIKKSISDMNHYNYLKLTNVFRTNVQVIRTLHLCYPQYLTNHSLFKKFAAIPLKIKNSFTFGYGNLTIFAVFFCIYIVMYVTGQLRQVSFQTTDSLTQILQMFSVLVSIAFASTLLTFLVREAILFFTQGRFLLYYFTPKTPE